ncbi:MULTISPECIES: hypothetical protein [Pseudomonas]|uniref:Uncharacterized protein n=1 Tax=Pseudomonas quercus TaxID=2722792 RepID=A0ABX0YD31_9PSED|nr:MULTISPECIES: hypothetical protein [Pseudomonas]MBF7141439.1 hypothetical protein [Pseudomonas sp. LY10J]NJO99977.1 hypothetical protein [Pseudomonas quercus]
MKEILNNLLLKILMTGLTSLLFSMTALAEKKAENLTGTLRVGTQQENTCSGTVTGEGVSIYGIGCHNSGAQVVLQDFPSTSKILLTESDCTESLESQGWWVMLEATALKTSTPYLSIQAIVEKANRWKANPDDPYVAPYLKITGADIKTNTGKVGCSLLTLAVTSLEAKKNRLPLIFEPSQAARDGKYSSFGGCSNGAMARIYSIDRQKFRYQCIRFKDGDGNEYIADEENEKTFYGQNATAKCDANMAVTYMSFEDEGRSPEDSFILCRKFKNTKDNTYMKFSAQTYDQRVIGQKENDLICQSPVQMGPEYLISAPDSIITGINRRSSEKRLFCSTYSR